MAAHLPESPRLVVGPENYGLVRFCLQANWLIRPPGASLEGPGVTFSPATFVTSATAVDMEKGGVHITVRVRVHELGENRDLKFTDLMHSGPELGQIGENGGELARLCRPEVGGSSPPGSTLLTS